MSESIFLCDPNCVGFSVYTMLKIYLGWFLSLAVVYALALGPVNLRMKRRGIDVDLRIDILVVVVMSLVFGSLTILLSWR